MSHGVRLRDVPVAVGGGGLLAAKLYLVHKYLGYRKRKQQEAEGVGIGPAKFAKLPRRRQQQVLYYKRGVVRELEGTYHRGDRPRRRRAF